jgi:predicted kinase
MATTRMVIVSGSPGSGKTGLAEQLGKALGFPVISRDSLKEVLMDIWPPHDRNDSEKLGRASWPLMFQVLDALLGRIPGVIVESNFVRGDSEADILDRLNRSTAILIHCSADEQVIAERIDARKDDHQRHEGHFDEQIGPDVMKAIEEDEYEPLELPIPVIRVDTTNGYNPSIEEILQTVRNVHPA